ncbi:MAG: BrnT family toxin [Gammaproteobacteria bacterium]|nr:MAG: BrnT family toxin [Gammaproteobacteria bacterium]
MYFEWDSNKAKINKNKHAVSFEEATSIFGDALSITFNDPQHSIDEIRYLTFGQSKNGKLLVVSHTEIDMKIRIISARVATKNERIIYEKG